MNAFLGQIFTLLTSPPGNLIYHIVLVFSIAGALQSAGSLLRTTQFPQVRRAVVGLSVLLGLQLLLFFISGLAWQGLVNSETVLPPLDRAVTLLSLAWIVWLWTFPEPLRLADAATVLLNLLGVTLLGLTLAFWVLNSDRPFNQSFYEIAWQGFSLAVILLGILGLALRRPNGWGNGLAMLILGFVGHLASLAFPLAGSFPGAVRLAQLAMFPILLTLSQRYAATPPNPMTVAVESKQVESNQAESKQAEESIQERRRYSTDPKAFHAMMSLAAETDPAKVAQAMTRGVAQAILADLCFLILLNDDKSMVIAAGYDLIREENLGGANMDREAVPLLANAIQRGKPLRLPASSTSSDLKGLGQILNLPNPGHLMNVPILAPKRGPVGGILVLSPYSNRQWSAEDQAYLSNVSSLFLPVLDRSEQIAKVKLERDQAIEEAKIAAEQAAEARRQAEQAAAELETEREKASQAQVQGDNVTALLAVQEETQKTIQKLQEENDRLHSAGGTPDGVNEQMERELRQTLEEMARMQNELGKANIKLLELEKHPVAPITNEQIEVIASISQELRQPMASIVGYTDLLLGESVGILGALQRKFVERIKASTERIGGLVDDLIQVTNLEVGKTKFKQEPVDLNLIIDNAMAYTSTQIREKNITLRLDVAGIAPRVRADRDAVQQILIHLLQNATAASHTEGNITLRMRMQDQDDAQFLAIQVTDSGGGIAAEDLQRVFARRYRAENSLIQGLGDTGVGLSLARALVEAQDGRIWVESEAGVGATFNVLIPLSVETPQES